MKLLRVGLRGAERPALLDDDGRLLDLSAHCEDVDGPFLAGGGLELPRPTRIGAPVVRPGKVVCVGLNYRDHAAETGAEIPGRQRQIVGQAR